MNARIDAFLTEIRNALSFVKVSAADPKWIGELEAIECVLNNLDRKAGDDPQLMETMDNIQSVVGHRDLSIKQRLLGVGKLLTQARDAIRIVH